MLDDIEGFKSFSKKHDIGTTIKIWYENTAISW